MADNYTQFSFMVPGPFTTAEREWLTTAVAEPEEDGAPTPDDRPWAEDGDLGFSAEFDDEVLPMTDR